MSDFRLVSTSNSSLIDAVGTGQFRSDLYFRLSGLTLNIPALNQRLVDLPDLVRHFLSDLGEGERHISNDALDALASYAWPGNVRELRHVITRAISAADSRDIDRQAVLQAVRMAQYVLPTRAADSRTALAALLSRHGWDTERVAEDLGVHRATVYRRMQRYGLNEDRQA
jgi:transcriptional regulator of acetoin/glycerol metabolism